MDELGSVRVRVWGRERKLGAEKKISWGRERPRAGSTRGFILGQALPTKAWGMGNAMGSPSAPYCYRKRMTKLQTWSLGNSLELQLGPFLNFFHCFLWFSPL